MTGLLRAICLGVLLSLLQAVDAQDIQPPRLPQFTVTGKGAEPFREADETCAKLGRMVSEYSIPATTNPNNSPWQLKFECYLPYEVASVDNDSYKIQVPTPMTGTVPFTIPAANGLPARTIQAPDVGTTSTRVEQLGREYCAKLNASMKIVGGGFDMGPGFRLTFKCVPTRSEAAKP